MTDNTEIKTCFAERYANMLEFTNDDPDMRTDLARLFHDHIYEIIERASIIVLLFHDTSVLVIADNKNSVFYVEHIEELPKLLVEMVQEQYLTMAQIQSFIQSSAQ